VEWDGLDGGANDVQHYYISKTEDGFAIGEPIVFGAGTDEYDDYGVAYGHLYSYQITAKDGENYSSVCGPIIVDLTNIPEDISGVGVTAGSPMTGDIAARIGAPGTFEEFAETGFGASGALKRSNVISCKPNPVTGTATFEITPPTPTRAKLDVYDLSGRRINTLLDGEVSGKETVAWEANVINGIYLYRLTLDNQTLTGKFIVSKGSGR
jgi:hypothetical protein